MKLKKMLLLPFAVAALAMAVFAGPAAANSDIHFLNADESPITTPVSVHFTGPASFENEAGGIACSETTAVVEFTTLGAHVREFNGLNCVTTGVLKAIGCELTSPSAPISTGLPWGITPESLSTGAVSGVEIDNPMQAECPVGSNVLATGNGVQINAVNEGEIGDVTLTGKLSTTIGEVDVAGALSPTPGEPTILVAET